MRKLDRTEWTLAQTGGDTLRLALDGLLLLAELGGTMLAVVSGYGVKADVLLLAAACLLATILYLFVFSIKRHGCLALFCVLALLGAAAWMLRNRLLGGASLVLDDALRTLSDVFPVEPRNDIYVPPGERKDAVTLFLSMMAFLLGSFMGWSVIRARSAALTALQSLAWIFPALLADVIPCWPVMMVLFWCWLMLLLSSLCARRDPRGSARFALLCAPAAALLLALVSILLPREDYRQPEWSAAVRRRLEQTVFSMTGRDGTAAFSGAAAVDLTVRLDQAGPRAFTGGTLLTVACDKPGRTYLRGVTAAQYTGTAWEPLPESAYSRIGLEEGKLEGISPLNFPSMTAGGQAFAEMDIQYSSLSGCMFTPYQLSTAPDEISGIDYRDDVCLIRRFGVREKNLYFRPEAAPETAAALSGAAARAEKNYRDFVYKSYLGLPERLIPKLTRWLEESRGALERDPVFAERLQRLYQRDYPERCARQLFEADLCALLLERTAEYDLNAPRMPEGEDFTDYFLSKSRRGYCIHFATAGALLLRMKGIPTRYAEGFTAVIPASGAVEVRDRDAHAWVEIYLDGYGWYPVDMTPSDGTGIASGSAVGVRKPEEQKEETERTEPKPSPPQQSEQRPANVAAPSGGSRPEAETGSAGSLWLLLLLPPAVLPLQAAARRALFQRRTRDPDANAAVIAIYGYFERLDAWGGKLPQSALELARKARFSPHTLAEEEREAMLRYAEDERERVWRTLSGWKRLLFLLSGL